VSRAPSEGLRAVRARRTGVGAGGISHAGEVERGEEGKSWEMISRGKKKKQDRSSRTITTIGAVPAVLRFLREMEQMRLCCVERS
jgi:hypothetical protein